MAAPELFSYIFLFYTISLPKSILKKLIGNSSQIVYNKADRHFAKRQPIFKDNTCLKAMCVKNNFY